MMMMVAAFHMTITNSMMEKMPPIGNILVPRKELPLITTQNHLSPFLICFSFVYLQKINYFIQCYIDICKYASLYHQLSDVAGPISFIYLVHQHTVFGQKLIN